MEHLVFPTKHIQHGAAFIWKLSVSLLLCPRLGIQLVTVAQGMFGGTFNNMTALLVLRVRSLSWHYGDIKQEHVSPLPHCQGIGDDGNFRALGAKGYPPG